MKMFLNAMLALVVLALIAGVIFVFMSLGGDDEKPEAAPTAKPIVHMSTSGIVDNIERKLGQNAGRALAVKCPKKVNEAIGTKFRCSVRYQGGADRIAIAHVKISGPQGEFTWTSSSDELRTPTPAPAS